MKSFKRFLYLFFSNKFQFIRKCIGGHWVKDKVDGFMWIHFDSSILSKHIDFEDLKNEASRYQTESWQ